MFSNLNVNSQEKIAKTITKLQNTMVSLCTKLAIIKAENNGLRLEVTTEKRRRKRGKPLIAKSRNESNGNAMFFSPKKIQEARDL